jgi:hypothetical protein
MMAPLCGGAMRRSIIGDGALAKLTVYMLSKYSSF